MPKVFISYRRKDTDASAGRLYDKLCPALGKENVFYDVDAIELGVDFVRELENRVGNCDVLLALIGPRWQTERLHEERDYVRLEIAAALERDVRVIPVLVDGVTLPSARELPKALVPLLNRNALDLNHARFHNDCERLIRAIERTQAPAPPPPKIAVAGEVAATENGLAACIRNAGLTPVRNAELVLVGFDRFVERHNEFTSNPFEPAPLCSYDQIPGDDAGDGKVFATFSASKSQLEFQVPGVRPLREAGIWRLEVSARVDGKEADRRELFVRWSPGETAVLAGDPRKELRTPPAVAPQEAARRPVNWKKPAFAAGGLLITMFASYPLFRGTPPVDVATRKDPFVLEADNQTYVWIPPGKFRMGCSPEDKECYDDEKPHDVEISRGFWLGETEVTQAAWRKVMGSSPSHFKGEELPVEQVDWIQASQYCAKVGGRLPTETEWEYAARAGTTTARYGELDAVSWNWNNSGRTTHPVRGRARNPFGLYDMLGNVWEWTADRYGPYDDSAVRDPKGPASGEDRVVRGGSGDILHPGVRASGRSRIGVSVRLSNIGFRCAGEFR